MEKSEKRQPVGAGSTRAAAAKLRHTVAQKLCNHLARDLERAMAGAKAVASLESGALVPLPLDLLHPVRLAQLRHDARWAPPKGAINALCLVAMVLWKWRIPRESQPGVPHPHAGERYSGIVATNDEMAALAGCHPDTWARHGRPFLERLELLVGLPTTKRNMRGWRARTSAGQQTGPEMRHREATTLYVPGDALYELLGIRDRRIERSHRGMIAIARRQLGLQRRNRRQIKGVLQEDRKNPDPKALKNSLSEKEKFFSRARGRMPIAHSLLKNLDRRRRKVRPAAAATFSRTTPASASTSAAPPPHHSQPANSRRLVTKGAGVGDDVGGECETPRQSAAVASGAAQAPPEGAAPPSSTDAAIDVGTLVGDLLRQIGPADVGARAAPSRRRSAPVDFGARVGDVLDEQRGWRKKRTPAPPPAIASPPPADPAPPVPPAAELLGGLFGAGDRTPEERAENERLRELAKQRARADSGDDDGGGAP